MSDYHLTNEAVQDLSNIWLYTVDAWSEEQADKYYEMLLTSCSNIAGNPNVGKNYNKITKNLFGSRANRHIIFYRIITKYQIEITRILHEQIDLENRILVDKST
ncbi:MAG: type II toxin-antitoxin system RelE/ParE family toxin [Reichenbachiella sp.]